ncbi:DUF2460 domain-containing protein [Mesorhizobium sp. KR9-304]|uniref:DUF2460 domain-containing protein n=1 Tax=Mesorhizobium sp. KR9-304 TaxID=3156614 RepID=UPI0032B4DE4F
MVDTVIFNEAFDVGLTIKPRTQTTIVPLSGGYESRNQDWPYILWEYECQLRNRSVSVIRDLMEHFLGRRGPANTFPLLDPLDNELTDENIGTGDSTTGSDGTAAFQIKKTYADTDRPYQRILTIVQNLVVKVDGVTKTLTTHYTVSNGLITFTAGNRPLTGLAVTVTCDYLIKVRYKEDAFPVIISTGLWDGAAASIGNFSLVEVLT